MKLSKWFKSKLVISQVPYTIKILQSRQHLKLKLNYQIESVGFFDVPIKNRTYWSVCGHNFGLTLKILK